MKKIYLILALNVISLFVFSQEFENKAYPNSIIDFGFGVGPNYGIIGSKMVIGYHGIGVMGGLGVIQGLTAYQYGIQVSQKWWFFNVSYGVIGISQYVDYYSSSVEALKGYVFITGCRINLMKSKLCFLELGVGYATASGNKRVSYINPNNYQGPSAIIGLGVRVFD